tara:strand:+ start:333 stop:524 length:192 start_codon:yes stop_codon:yes gene_type:complete
MSRYKRLTILIGDNSLDGLVIDWHLGDYDYTVAETNGINAYDTFVDTNGYHGAESIQSFFAQA